MQGRHLCYVEMFKKQVLSSILLVSIIDVSRSTMCLFLTQVQCVFNIERGSIKLLFIDTHIT
jgi:hypothetical protein